MKSNLVRVMLIAIAVVALAGCYKIHSKLLGVKSSGVEKIPTKLGFYPILSEPASYYSKPGIITEPRYEKMLNLQRGEGDKTVVITPPAGSQLSITQESQILTGLISTQLSLLGFSLKELPVEILPEETNADKKPTESKFAISLDLLNRLREQYNFTALLIGDAFFANMEYLGSAPDKVVTVAHFRVVDINTLDILGQVSLTYSSKGLDINDAAEQIALELAKLADLAIEEKK